MEVVHGDDFVFVGLDMSLGLFFGGSASKIRVEEPWTAQQRRRGCKSDRHARQKAAMVRLGLTWQASSRHKALLMEYFGMKDNVKVLSKNGYRHN